MHKPLNFLIFLIGIVVAPNTKQKRGIMKKPIVKRLEENSMQPNFVAILALVTEMAKRVNENISKVQLKPLDGSLATAASQPQVESAKA
jgi:hypothetical protein